MIYTLSEYMKRTSGIYKVPTDWTVIISYNIRDNFGEINIETWVEEY